MQLSAQNHVLLNKSNEELMAEFQAGNEEAFKVLYENFKNPIYSYVYGMIKDSNRSNELAQDVFLKVFKNKDKYDSSQKFSTWLWTIARNTTIDSIRKNDPLKFAKTSSSNEDGEEVSLVEQVPSDMLEQSELLMKKAEKEAIEKCLTTLKSSQEEVLRLRILSELSYDEIAKTVEQTVSAIKSLINRAKKSLLTCLKECLDG